ncbi:MAG: hypothetical protein ACE363_02660 [Alphaproteobacteria bacterium]
MKIVGQVAAALVALVWAGSAMAHVTGFDPGMPPSEMQNVTFTLPSGDTAMAVTADECEQKKLQGDDCDDDRFGLFIVTDGALRVGEKVDYVWYQDNRRRTGTATVGRDGNLYGAPDPTWSSRVDPAFPSYVAIKGGIGNIDVGDVHYGAIKLDGGNGAEVPFLSNDKTVTTYGGGIKGEFALGNFGNFGNAGNARNRGWTLRFSGTYAGGDNDVDNEIPVDQSLDQVPAVSFFEPIFDGTMDSFGINLGGFGLQGVLDTDVETWEFAANLGPVFEVGENTFLRPNIGIHYEEIEVEHHSRISTILSAEQISFETVQKTDDERIGGGIGLDFMYIDPNPGGFFAGIGGEINFNHLNSRAFSTQMINIDLVPDLDNQVIEQDFKQDKFSIDWQIRAMIGVKLTDSLSIALAGSYSGTDELTMFRNRVFGDSDPNTFVVTDNSDGWNANLVLGLTF